MSRILKNGDNQITQKYKSGIHNGIDIVKKKASLDYVVAHTEGEIIDFRSDYKTTDKTGNSYGNYVKIKHPNGKYTLYAHLKHGSVKVSKGDHVEKGQIIGYIGATGHAVGAHLHFEVRNELNVKIDPTPYINNDLPVIEDVKENSKNEETNVKMEAFILNLVKRTIRGDFGNGATRKERLGKYYEEVQNQVNLNVKNNTTNWNNIKLYK